MKIKVILIALMFSNFLNFSSKALYGDYGASGLPDPEVIPLCSCGSPTEYDTDFPPRLRKEQQARPSSAIPWLLDTSGPCLPYKPFDDWDIKNRCDPNFFPCFNYSKSPAMIYEVKEYKDSIIIHTHYSEEPIELNRENPGEGVLIDIIKSDAFQRLKYISHYGPSNFVPNARNILYNFNKFGNYTRYEHCLGVLIILLLKYPNCSLYEKIAAIMHDVAHTAFSHLADFLLGPDLHDRFEYLLNFFRIYGLQDILNHYDIKFEKIFFLRSEENNTSFLPSIVKQGNGLLCADNIEYHLNGCYKAGILDIEQVKRIFQNLHYDLKTQRWYLFDLNSAICFKVAVDHLIQNNCLSLWNKKLFKYVATEIKKAMADDLITVEDIMYDLPDNVIWYKVFNKSMIEYANGLVPRGQTEEPILAKNDGEVVKDRRINPWIRVQYKIKRYKFKRLRDIFPTLYD